MFINSVTELFPDFCETSEDGLPFTLGHVQGFIRFVRKERVILHLSGK